MTEAEWLSAKHPRPMLESFRDAASERKLRLFASACCRRIWHLFTDGRCQEAVELAERFADGTTTDGELDEAHTAVSRIDVFAPDVTFFDRCFIRAAGWAVNRNVMNAAAMAAESAAVVAAIPAESAADEPVAQAAVLRDIFGTPFRPLVEFSPEWRTDTAVALARAMYESRDFSAMPILADAIQDAGGGGEDVLTHCRGEGPHVRGCWVVDLVLEKQ